ncbi:MAG TPA: hypothetical protein VJV78_11545 [Polyangiales bacterium]|nr:hypothetical protein [Polyangiales bacterium]
MSLTTWAQLHAPALEREDRPAKVHERVALRIHDRERPMPPRGHPTLTAHELSSLDAWLQLDAPAGAACPTGSTSAMPDEPPDAGETAPRPDASEPADAARPPSRPMRDAADAAPEPEQPTQPSVPDKPKPPEVMQPMAAPEDKPVKPDDSECTYIELRARKDKSGAPYEVAAEALDSYVCFVFNQAFSAPTQALSISPIWDNRKVLHHWLLYASKLSGADADATTVDCGTFSSNAALLAGGGPGGADWNMPKHVGLDIGSGQFVLELHYNNIGKPADVDRSGARLCTTQKLRQETAVVSWLGNQVFSIPPGVNDFPIAGRCKPEGSRPIHLLHTWPHMHGLGRRMSMRLDRADGSSSTVFDIPFAAEAQKQYDIPTVLQPGDSLLTTCYYDNPNPYPVNVGNRTSDEMCNNFVIAYPAGALTTNFLNLVNNSCLGLP